MQKIHSKDYAQLEKTINRKLRKVGTNYGIRNLYRTAQGAVSLRADGERRSA